MTTTPLLLHRSTVVIAFLFLSTVQAWSPATSRLSTTSLSMLPSKTSQQEPKHVVIVGAGMVGTATAYYLAKTFGIKSTIIDPSGTIAPAASGKAGGFLALDWNDMSPTGRLCRRSFALHQELADALGSDNIDYRRLTCASIAVDPESQGRRPSGKKLDGVEWAGEDTVLGAQPMGDENTIAQVHPKKLCNALWNVASRSKDDGGVGSTLIKGKAVEVVRHDNDDKVRGVQLEDGTVVEGDAVLLACGPWTANIMMGVKYHAVVIPTPSTLNQCVFFSGAGDPEVYVRPDATAYCCGFPDPLTETVTEEPGQEEVRPEAVERIVDAVRAATGEDTDILSAEPTLASACYLPTTPDNLPIMGRLSDPQNGGGGGCYIATGHSCWGILMGPGTGESMATLIATGEDSTGHVSLRPFDPSRFESTMRVLK